MSDDFDPAQVTPDPVQQPGPNPGPTMTALPQSQPASLTGPAIEQVALLARQAAQPSVFAIQDSSIRHDPIFVMAVPQEGGLVSIQSVRGFLEPYREHPERIEGITQALTLESFIDLVGRHRNPNSVVFADLYASNPHMTAVIDYHTLENEPRRGVHKITYAWPQSREWKAWKAKDGQAMPQIEWAQWIEDHIAELASPTAEERVLYQDLFKTTIAEPSDLIALSRGLSISVEQRVKNVQVLQTGEAQIVYEEEHRDGATGQKLTVPGLFIVKVPLFEEAPASRLVARLRYRKKDSSIFWFFQFYRADQTIIDQLRSDVVDVHATLDLPTFDVRA